MSQVQTALGAIVRDSAARELPCGVFGSFGWSGEAVDELENRLKVSESHLNLPEKQRKVCAAAHHNRHPLCYTLPFFSPSAVNKVDYGQLNASVLHKQPGLHSAKLSLLLLNKHRQPANQDRVAKSACQANKSRAASAHACDLSLQSASHALLLLVAMLLWITCLE